MIHALSLGLINALLGGILGGIKLAVLVSVILILTDALDKKINFIDPGTREESKFYKPVKNMAPDLWKEIKENKE